MRNSFKEIIFHFLWGLITTILLFFYVEKLSKVNNIIPLQKMTFAILIRVKIAEHVKFCRWTHIIAPALWAGLGPTVIKVSGDRWAKTF